jgi:peroxiredoxin
MKTKTIKNLVKYLLLLSTIIGLNCQASLKINKTAPNFILKSSGGGNISLSELRGKVVVINFWATWCVPCRQEVPQMEKLYQRFSKKGLTIVAINVGNNSDKAKRISKELGITFPILFDSDSNVSEEYGVFAMPSTYFVDRTGNLRKIHRSFELGDEKKYKKIIKALLKE